MKQITHCPNCKSYAYVDIISITTVYKGNKIFKKINKFKCLSCGKKQTIVNNEKDLHS